MITKAEHYAIILEFFNAPPEGLTALSSGHMSQTYSFQIGSVGYIIRSIESALSHGYFKDQFAHQRFSSPQLPIPPILKIAQHANQHYAISKMVDGRELIALSPDEYRKTIPAILNTLHAIHQVDVSSWQGYGYIDVEGNGDTQSWEEFHKKIIKETPEGTFYGNWHRLFETSFLDRTFFESVYQKMVSLLAYCPEERYLLHGDFGYDNVLAEGGEVTAVLDWANAKYGDFVSDIAYLSFWKPNDELLTAAKKHYESMEMNMDAFAERLLCYKLYLGLDGLRFYAKIGDEQAYQATCDTINGLLHRAAHDADGNR